VQRECNTMSQQGVKGQRLLVLIAVGSRGAEGVICTYALISPPTMTVSDPCNSTTDRNPATTFCNGTRRWNQHTKRMDWTVSMQLDGLFVLCALTFLCSCTML
jgi:hypothetical protein